MAAAVVTTAGFFALAADSAPTAPAAGGLPDAPPMYVKGGSGLTFQIDVLGPDEVADVPVLGPIMFEPFAGPPLFSVDLAENVLCVQNGAQQGVQLELTDTNGRMSVFDGFAGFSYFPSAAAPVQGLTLKVATDANPRCAEIPLVAQTVSTDASPVECAAASTLFHDGFENAGGVGSGPNLQVDFRLISHPNTSTGDPAVYDIHVTNCGDATAAQVGVRDIFPTLMAPAPRLLAGGTWECVSGAACDGNQYVNTVFSSIAPGGSRVIRATRQREAGVAGEMIRVSAAAISLSNTPDVQPSFNSGSWDFEIRSNDPPTVTVTGTADSLAEDDGTVRVTGVTIAAADTDGFITSVAVNSLNSSILTVASVDDTDPANVRVDVTTVPDAYGTATLQVIATDDLGGTSAPVNFQIAVDPINDPPTITVKGGFDYNGGVPTFAGNCTEASVAGCADQSYPADVGIFDANFPDWVVQVSPGPANEAGQTTTVGIGAPSDPGLFLGAGFQPELIERVGGTWDLDYGLSGDSGTATLVITVNDGEPLNNVTTLSFDIFVDNGPPVVTAGQTFEIDEGSSGPVGTLVGTDPENDPLSGWAIVGGNTDVDADTNPAFAIDPASGQISVNDPDDLDFEDTPSFTLSVTVSDGNSTSAPGNVTVDLNDVNDNAPVVTSGLTFLVAETSTSCAGNPGTCTVTATDVDTVGSLQGWAIVAGNVNVDQDGNLPFAINPASGLITVNDPGDMDYEQMPSFALMVTVGDGVNTSAQELVTIDLLNTNDNDPVVDPGQVFAVDENTAATTFVGTVTGTDPDGDPLQNWAIVGGNDDVDMDMNPAFAIDTASGAITVNDADDLDFETQNQFNLSIMVEDGLRVSAAETVTINLNDVSEPQ